MPSAELAPGSTMTPAGRAAAPDTASAATRTMRRSGTTTLAARADDEPRFSIFAIGILLFRQLMRPAHYRLDARRLKRGVVQRMAAVQGRKGLRHAGSVRPRGRESFEGCWCRCSVRCLSGSSHPPGPTPHALPRQGTRRDVSPDWLPQLLARASRLRTEVTRV